MAIHNLRTVNLEDLEGRGFVFTITSGHHKDYQGVFFLEHGAPLERLLNEDEITYEGVVYDDRRGERRDTIPVTIVDIVSTPTGERAEFVGTENK